MTFFEQALAWFSEHESALSGMAAFVALGALILSPIGKGVRSFFRGNGNLHPPSDSERSEKQPSVSLEATPSERDDDRRLTQSVHRASATWLTRAGGVSYVAKPEQADYVASLSAENIDRRYRAALVLRDRATGEQIWSNEYRTEGDDFFSVQDEFVSRISDGLRFAIFEEHGNRIGPDDELHTVENLLSRIASLIMTMQTENWERAALLQKRAMDLEPDNASGMSLGAYLVLRDVVIGQGCPAPAALEDAKNKLRGSLQRNQRSDFAHATLGMAHVYERNWDAARSEFDRSQELNPHYSYVMWGIASLEAFTGRADQAIACAERVLAPDLSATWKFVGARVTALAHFVAGDYEEACRWAERSDQVVLDSPQSLLILAAARSLAGSTDLGLASVTKLHSIDPDLKVSTIRRWPFQENDPWDRLVEGWRLAGLAE